MMPGTRQWVAALSRERRQQYEERAAIMEHHGGLARDDAEERARRDCVLYWGALLGRPR